MRCNIRESSAYSRSSEQPICENERPDAIFVIMHLPNNCQDWYNFLDMICFVVYIWPPSKIMVDLFNYFIYLIIHIGYLLVHLFTQTLVVKATCITTNGRVRKLHNGNMKCLPKMKVSVTSLRDVRDF